MQKRHNRAMNRNSESFSTVLCLMSMLIDCDLISHFMCRQQNSSKLLRPQLMIETRRNRILHFTARAVSVQSVGDLLTNDSLNSSNIPTILLLRAVSQRLSPILYSIPELEACSLGQ